MADDKDSAKKPSNLPMTLVVTGMGLFSIEQFGLGKLGGPNSGIHIDGTILSILVLAPIALVVAGAVMFMMRRMRRR